MINDYKIKSKVIPGAIYLRYEHGALTAVGIELNDQMNDQVWEAFKSRLKRSENLTPMKEGFVVTELNTAKSVQDKIVLFCSYYKHYREVPYKAKELEKANLKNVPVTRELLDTFFKSPLANYTLDNYIKRINITRDWNKNGMNNHLANAMPDEYNAEYERTLDGPKLSEYRKHLIELGWVKDQRGFWHKAASLVLILLFMTACVSRDPRYRQTQQPAYIDTWVTPKHPKKVNATGEKEKKKRKRKRNEIN
jgi:hypothetical protein